jgi:hypothetical protein
MVEKLIRCTRCNKVIPQFGPFGDFGEVSLFPGVEWSSEDMDEQKEFLNRHHGHPLEELFIDRETFISDKPSYEPIKVVYMEASNGKQRFLIKRTRLAFDRPAFYELILGRIKIADVSLEIQEDELERQISWMNGSFPFPVDKVKKFIEAFREELKSIPPESLDAAIETTLPGETSLVSYGSFSEARWEKVLHRCEHDFHKSELKLIEKFIRENRQPGDVLSLKIKKAISISAA